MTLRVDSISITRLVKKSKRHGYWDNVGQIGLLDNCF